MTVSWGGKKVLLHIPHFDDAFLYHCLLRENILFLLCDGVCVSVSVGIVNICELV